MWQVGPDKQLYEVWAYDQLFSWEQKSRLPEGSHAIFPQHLGSDTVLKSTVAYISKLEIIPVLNSYCGGDQTKTVLPSHPVNVRDCMSL